jgi:hypothetical protein
MVTKPKQVDASSQIVWVEAFENETNHGGIDATKHNNQVFGTRPRGFSFIFILPTLPAAKIPLLRSLFDCGCGYVLVHPVALRHW